MNVSIKPFVTTNVMLSTNRLNSHLTMQFLVGLIAQLVKANPLKSWFLWNFKLSLQALDFLMQLSALSCREKEEGEAGQTWVIWSVLNLVFEGSERSVIFGARVEPPHQTCQPPKRANLETLQKSPETPGDWDLKPGDFQNMCKMKIKMVDFLFQGILYLICATYCILLPHFLKPVSVSLSTRDASLS